MKVVIHIGLHKTGSTYLQNHVFPFLKSDSIIYNPDDIFYFINAIFTLDIKDISFLEKAKNYVQEYEKQNENSTLFISSEGISQLSFQQNYKEQVDALKFIFPEAEIILFLREQSKWLESCYKESVKHYSYQSIENFLNYKNGEFERSDIRFDEYGYFSMDVYQADWLSLYKLISKEFNNINLFFYEDFKKDNISQVNKILNIIGETEVCELPSSYANKGRTKEHIDILIMANKIRSVVGLKSKTYMHSWSKERDDILSHKFFWKPSKPHFIYRAIRALYREPIRILQRLSLRNILIKIDSIYYAKKHTPVLNDEIRAQIQIIHKKSNADLASLFEDIPQDYLYEMKNYQSKNKLT